MLDPSLLCPRKWLAKLPPVVLREVCKSLSLQKAWKLTVPAMLEQLPACGCTWLAVQTVANKNSLDRTFVAKLARWSEEEGTGESACPVSMLRLLPAHMLA